MSKQKPLYIVLFNQDLRLTDNPAFEQACKKGEVFPVYIHNEENALGSAAKLVLHYSLKSLDVSLKGKLNYYKAKHLDALKDVVDKQISIEKRDGFANVKF